MMTPEQQAALSPSQQAVLEGLDAAYNASRFPYTGNGLTDYEHKLIRKQVRFEGAFRMGYEPIVYDFEAEDHRPYRKGDDFVCQVRCPHCGRTYRYNQGTWMERHLTNKHGDKGAWRRRMDIPEPTEGAK
jgi:adenine-specific DNA methylase